MSFEQLKETVTSNFDRAGGYPAGSGHKVLEGMFNQAVQQFGLTPEQADAFAVGHMTGLLKAQQDANMVLKR